MARTVAAMTIQSRGNASDAAMCFQVNGPASAFVKSASQLVRGAMASHPVSNVEASSSSSRILRASAVTWFSETQTERETRMGTNETTD